MASIQPIRRKPIVQKIVIPSGLVKPNETVVIEVPSSLKKHAVVIATRPKNERDNHASKGVGDDISQSDRPIYVAAQSANQSQESEQDQEPAEEYYDVLEAEKAERDLLFKNLIAFHKARRDVLCGTKAIIAKSFTGENIDFDYQRTPTQSYQNLYRRPNQQKESNYYDMQSDYQPVYNTDE